MRNPAESAERFNINEYKSSTKFAGCNKKVGEIDFTERGEDRCATTMQFVIAVVQALHVGDVAPAAHEEVRVWDTVPVCPPGHEIVCV